MSLVAVIGLELRQWVKVYPVAAGIGVLAAATPWLPGIGRDPEVWDRWLAATVVAFALAIGTALVRGATMVGGELWLKRASFLYARPLAASSIWAGKYLGTLALSWGSAALAVFPTALAALVRGRWAELEWLPAIPLAVATLATLAAAHVAGVALASQSRLVLAELIALAVAIWVGFRLLEGVLRWEAPQIAGWTLGTTVLVLFALLLAAGWVQMAWGRCDALRGHRVQALVLWSGVTVVLGALAVWGAFLAAATPRSLRTVTVARPGPERWLFVGGRSWGRADAEAAFLFNTRTSNWRAVGPWKGWEEHITFSANGTRAAWVAPQFSWGVPEWQLFLANLAGPTPEVRATPHAFASKDVPQRLALSPDGSRLLLVEEKRAEVYECDPWRRVGSLALPSGFVITARFRDPEKVRLRMFLPLATGGDERRGEFILADWRIADQQWREVWRSHETLSGMWKSVENESGTRLLLHRREQGNREVQLYDTDHGEPVATLGRWPEGEIGRGFFCADGRVVLGVREDGVGLLRVFSAQGVPLASWRLTAGGRPRPMAEPTVGVVLVSLPQESFGQTVGRAYELVELSSGQRRPLPAGYVPQGVTWGDGYPAPGSLAARLLLSPGGGLALLDGKSGVITPLLGRP